MAHNAIEWGNSHQSDRLVDITYLIFDDRVEIVVRDQGPGFDRTALPHAAVAGDPFSHLDVREKLGLRTGGFGLLICQGMVDEMRYNDVGNEVTLIKRFVPSRHFHAHDDPPGSERFGECERNEVTLDQHQSEKPHVFRQLHVSLISVLGAGLDRLTDFTEQRRFGQQPDEIRGGTLLLSNFRVSSIDRPSV